MGADSYIVQAFGVQEHEISCETRSQSCMLPKLLCGFTYNVSVIAVNSVCNVSQSDVTQLQAGKDREYFAAMLSVVLLLPEVILYYACSNY